MFGVSQARGFPSSVMLQIIPKAERRELRSETPGDHSDMMPLRAGQMSWHVDPALVDELFEAGCLKLEEWLRTGAAEIVKSGPHRTVYRLQLGSGRYYLKHYKIPDWRAFLQNVFRPCKAWLEFNASQRVTALGIETFRTVAVGRSLSGLFTTDNYLISREIENAETVQDFILHSIHRLPVSKQSRIRRQLACGLADIAARLHLGGLIHRDFHAGNILLRLEDDDSLRLWLIDLHALSGCRRLTLRKMERNLSLLNNFFSHVSTASDRLRFFRSYWEGLSSLPAPGCPSLKIPAPDAYPRIVRRIEAFCDQSVFRAFRKADRKWIRGNRRLIIADSADRLCRGIASLGTSAIEEIRDDPEGLFERSNVRSWRQRTQDLRVAAVELNLGERRYRCLATAIETSRWADRSRRFGRHSVVRRAWETGHAFARRGIACVRPLLFVETKAESTAKQYLLTEEIPNTIVLSDYLQDLLENQSAADRERWLKRYANRLADQIGRMHRCGFEHQRLSAESILVSRDNSACKTWFLELENVDRRRRRLSHERTALALAQLNVSLFSCKRLRNSHRLGFLKRYLTAQPSCDWKRLWRAIERHSARLLLAETRKQEPVAA